MTPYQYQVGGSLATEAPSYVVRQADSEIYEALKQGQFCYVLNSRQMGKSSLLVQARHRLQQEGFRCSTVDMTRIGSETITPAQWYKGIVTELWRGFNLLGKVNLKSWWLQEEELPLLQRLSNFIEDILLEKISGSKIIIFIDEIDSILSLDFPIDDFFAFIRFCYNQRSINPDYNRIAFAIFGVATPSDLMADKTRTPFNIGKAIEVEGFKLEEAQPLALGLAAKFENAKAILKEILAWTGGQPFLTQKLCQLISNLNQEAVSEVLQIPAGVEAFWVESVVRNRIIHKWESQDEPEHLRTIRDRLLCNEQRTGRLLGLYQQILQGVEVPADDSRDRIELLLSGLVVKQQGLLKVKNRIYQEVFNTEWVDKQLNSLRPYSQAFEAWIVSKQTDPSRLLRGQALIDAQKWALGKSLSDEDYQFLAKSEELDRREVQQALEAERAQEIAARLTEEQKRLAEQKKNARRQRVFLGIISLALAIASGLGVSTFVQYQRAVISERQAKISEIEAIATSSDALFALNKRFDALIQALRARQRLQVLPDPDLDTKTQVEKVLRQAVYGVDEYNRFSGHTAGVRRIAFSPQGQILASASDDNTIKLWQLDGTLLTTLKGHTATIRGLAFSPQGNRIASASDDNTIKLWQLNTTSHWETYPDKTLQGHSAAVGGVAFSPDGQIIASASSDKTVKLWKQDGTELATLKGHSDRVLGVNFSPDGQIMASASGDKTVKLWRIDGTLLTTLSGHTDDINKVVFSPDGQIIASASSDKTVKLWQRDGRLLTTLKGHTEPVWGVAIASDSQVIASASDDKTIKFWQKDGTPFLTLRGHEDWVNDIAYAPSRPSSSSNEAIVASASSDKTVRLWRLKNDLLTILRGHNNRVMKIAVSPDGQTIASVSGDKLVKLWKRDGTELMTLKGHSEEVRGVAFSPDGQTIASVSSDKTVKLWKKDGTALATLTGHRDRVWGVAFSLDGQTIASASIDKTVKLWKKNRDKWNDRPDKTLNGYGAGVLAVAFSPDGQTLASASIDNTVQLWKANGGEWENHPYQTLNRHEDRVWGVAFSPDGQTIASASGDQTVKLWQRDGTLLKTLTGHSKAVRAVSFSPDGQTIATGSSDSTIKLWKLDGTELATLAGHSDGVWTVGFTPDGKTIVSGGNDYKVILWNVDGVVALDKVLAYGCAWVGDYLRTNGELKESDRNLCEGLTSPLDGITGDSKKMLRLGLKTSA
ncbi:MAG TPA: hypothetical protein DDZ80_29100 [Cyanobacteria bacterium UBA8803]|nr:hypothetical protein [Cyanobacteria bacterium UBA9273]HBL62310.1 hypothetical protein [Cyanobacteria bacterium UBA8803]